MNKISGYTKHLKGYGKPITASAAAIGFISDFLQPLASCSKWILIFCAAVCVLSVPLLAFDNYRKHVVSAYVYSLLMCLICGPLYYIQISGYSQYGVFAYIFPKVHSLQDKLGLTKRLDNISADVKSIKGDVSDIKSEVTKVYQGGEILDLVSKSNASERIDLLFDFERYHVVGRIGPNDFMKIFELYPDSYKKKLISELSDNVEANLSAEQYLTGFKYPTENLWAGLMGDKLESKMRVEDLQKHLKVLPFDKSNSDSIFHLLRHTNIASSNEAIDVLVLFGHKSLYYVLNDNKNIRFMLTQVVQYVAKLPKNERAQVLNKLLEHAEPINAAGIIQIIEQAGVKPDEALNCLSSKKVEIKKSSHEDFERLKRIANNSFVWRMYDERLHDY